MWVCYNNIPGHLNHWRYEVGGVVKIGFIPEARDPTDGTLGLYNNHVSEAGLTRAIYKTYLSTKNLPKDALRDTESLLKFAEMMYLTGAWGHYVD